MTVLFHGSFGLNRSRMAGLLARALEFPDLKDKELAEPFGYGAPFAGRYRSWLHKCGISEMGLPIKLTDKGQVVVAHDPEFDHPVTQWLLHHELVTDPERAEAWHYFAKEFLPKYKSFTKDQLLMGLMEKLRAHSEQHFGPGSKLNITIRNKIIEVYSGDQALGALGLIKKDGGKFVRQTVKPLGPWKTADALENTYRSIG